MAHRTEGETAGRLELELAVLGAWGEERIMRGDLCNSTQRGENGFLRVRQWGQAREGGFCFLK